MTAYLIQGMFLSGLIGGLILIVINSLLKDVKWKTYGILFSIGLVLGGFFVDTIYELAYLGEYRENKNDLNACNDNIKQLSQRQCAIQNKTFVAYASSEKGVLVECGL